MHIICEPHWFDATAKNNAGGTVDQAVQVHAAKILAGHKSKLRTSSSAAQPHCGSCTISTTQGPSSHLALTHQPRPSHQHKPTPTPAPDDMKLLPIALLASSAVASSWYPGKGSQVTIKEDFSVPGKNPLLFCNDPKDDILTIDKVDLDPNPPEAGTTLSFTAKGSFSKDVEEGAKVHLQVKYGLITLINQEADLCEQVKNVDLECPLKKGPAEITKEVELPNRIPPGKYTVLADVFTKDGEKITCLTATVVFS